MKINKSQLQTALEIVKPGLASKEMIQQSTSFAFRNGAVTTYNDEISITHPVEGLEIEGAIHAEELYKLLTKIKEEEIDVQITGNQIELKAGRIKAGITLQSEIKLPLKQEIVLTGKWHPLPENFIKFVKFAMGSCSKDQGQAKLICVHVNQDGRIEGSDGFRIAQCTLKEDMPVSTFLLPASSAEEVIKLEPTMIMRGDGWAHFKAEETVISCRVFAEQYPNTAKWMTVEGPLLTFPQTLESIIDRAGIFAKREHMIEESVTVTIQNNRIKLSSESDSGWFEEEANIAYKGDPISFNITPYLLKGILAETQGCTCGSSQLKFEGDGWIYISTLRKQ